MEPVRPDELTASGVSWAAVIGGAFVAAAMALILLSLGTGLGLSSVSPWANSGASPGAIGAAAIIWLIVAQILAFGLGGYVAGRLRVRWATVHNDEVYFRDTAHGLLVWSVAAVVTAGVLATAAADMAGAARAREGARAGGGAMSSSEPSGPAEYAVDGAFRSAQTTPDRADPSVRAEVGRIFAHALRSREMGTADKTYVDSLVASRTGLSQADADQRVTQVFGELQQAIDVARSRAAKLALWVFIALLTGAFCASFAATIGGRQRDHVQHI
jgi:hypothetical protein